MRTFPLPGLFAWRWPAESEPRIDLRREPQVSFWLGAASDPTGRLLPAGCPGSVLAAAQECVCAGQGGGIATQRKGKAASLFFLPQTLSHFNRWERQGSRLRPSAAWPRASERESELDTITSMSNTGSLPCRAGRACTPRWEGLSRAGLRHAKAVRCIFFARCSSSKRIIPPLHNWALACESSTPSVILLLAGLGGWGWFCSAWAQPAGRQGDRRGGWGSCSALDLGS